MNGIINSLNLKTMKLKVVLIILLLNIKLSVERYNQNNLNMFYDYDSSWDKLKNDLRQRFLDKKKRNQQQNMKIQLFDNINSNKTLFVAGIMHILEDNLKNEMENSFRNMLRMNGSKYTFKRDFFWRTWREVTNESGNSSIIYYKCQSIINETCAKCRSGGYWVIEEKPPKCPIEILSLKTERELCIVNYTQYFKPYNSCPSVITMRDLRISCGNPIDTKWRIKKTYGNNITERNTNVICQGRESCEISTLYWIMPDYIAFRIINSTNNIIYSRLMKAGSKNYICIGNCGIFNPNTKEITKKEEPLTLDLLKNFKNKRENKPNAKDNKIKYKMIENSVELLKNGLHYKEVQHKMNEWKTYKVKDMSFNKNKIDKMESSTKAHCKKIKEKYLEKDEDDSYYDYDYV